LAKQYAAKSGIQNTAILTIRDPAHFRGVIERLPPGVTHLGYDPGQVGTKVTFLFPKTEVLRVIEKSLGGAE
jgi:hypothetical protein